MSQDRRRAWGDEPHRRAASSERGLRWGSIGGLVGLMAFWIALMTALYFVMEHVRQPREAVVTGEGTLVIPRHADGHFRIAGTVNGEPVMFLVDTGASLIAVTEALAQRAGLTGGEHATFRTANGMREGRIVRADAVVLRGGMGVSHLRVGTGLSDIGDDADALLGQNFLQHFDVAMTRSQLELRRRAP